VSIQAAQCEEPRRRTSACVRLTVAPRYEKDVSCCTRAVGSAEA
jgi:hypothetical protein